MIVVRNPADVVAVAATKLAHSRATAIAHVNSVMGEVRKRYITTAPGQDMLYLAKEEMALNVVADPAPDPLNYKLLAAEIGKTAPDLYQVAQVILYLANYWREEIAPALEDVRLGAIYEIENVATTPAEVTAAVAVFDAIVQALP